MLRENALTRHREREIVGVLSFGSQANLEDKLNPPSLPVARGVAQDDRDAIFGGLFVFCLNRIVP